MRILVKPRKWIESRLDKDPFFVQKFNFISIFSTKCFSPFMEELSNVLKLEFDDITDSDGYSFRTDGTSLTLFSASQAVQIVQFAQRINRKKILVVHCDAGISRSGAIGVVLNEYCNCILEKNPDDYLRFVNDNPDITPNSLVVRLMREETGI